jgi:hypothetical protein
VLIAHVLGRYQYRYTGHSYLLVSEQIVTHAQISVARLQYYAYIVFVYPVVQLTATGSSFANTAVNGT